MQPGLCLGNKRLYNIPRGFLEADATAANAPSVARLQLALPSVAGHCWVLQGIFKSL